MEAEVKSERFSYKIANRSRLTKPVIVRCNIGETFTPALCCKIVTEIAKYIFCNKLVPYPYATLKNIAENFNHGSMEELGHLQRRKDVQMRRHHRKVVEAYRNFESIFQNIHLELQNCAACGDMVEEVVLLIGATSRSPREVYRIVVPPVSCVESDQKQSVNKILLNLVRYIVLSEDLTDMLNQPISPTNMFVMLKKKQGTQSHWFVPNDSYSLPLCGRQAVITLGEPVVQQVDRDTIQKEVTEVRPGGSSEPVDAETKPGSQQTPLLELLDSLHIDAKSTQWFQSRICLKGFRLCKKGGLPVRSSSSSS